MKIKIIGLLFLFCTAFNISNINAQEDYRAEIGINGGGSFYLGDANTTLFKNMQPTFGLIYRHKLNPRIAGHISWNSTSVAIDTLSVDGTLGKFKNPVNVIDICGEFNFFDLEKKEYRPFSKTFSTFLFAGIGGMLYEYENSTNVTASIPFGVGFKVMLGERFNLNLMWSNRILLSDKLEGIASLNNAAGLNRTNIFNNDLLSTISVGLTFNIFKEKCDCANELR